MVSLDKRVKMYVLYKMDTDGRTYTRAYFGEKNDSDISRILSDLFKRNVPLNSPIQVIQPNWAGTGETVTLVDYQPFQSIWTNPLHVRNVGQK